MAHDLTDEQIITLREACSLFRPAANGKPVHISRLYRYTTHGCRGVRLEWLQCGGTRCTTVQSVQRFFRRLTEVLGGTATVDRGFDQTAALESGKRLANLGKMATRQ